MIKYQKAQHNGRCMILVSKFRFSLNANQYQINSTNSWWWTTGGCPPVCCCHT